MSRVTLYSSGKELVRTRDCIGGSLSCGNGESSAKVNPRLFYFEREGQVL